MTPCAVRGCPARTRRAATGTWICPPHVAWLLAPDHFVGRVTSDEPTERAKRGEGRKPKRWRPA